MESIAASPETAMDLIAKAGRLTAEAIILVGEVLAAAEPEAVCAVLQNLSDSLIETAAVLRAREVPAGAFALARRAGDAEGYERGLEDGRREGHAGRRARARHLALLAAG